MWTTRNNEVLIMLLYFQPDSDRGVNVIRRYNSNMDTNTISTVQRIIAVTAIIYLISPDLIIGPLDDVIVAIVATITDVILGITKERLTIVPNPD